MHHGEVELVADKVTGEIDDWLKTKKQVSSQEIFEQAVDTLAKYNPDAAFMYKTHRDLS
jgi:hypothetical protein